MTGFILFAILCQQPSLEQQAHQSLDKADKALTDARAAYASHDVPQTKKLVAEMLTDVEAAEKALSETGKNARRRPKEFKFGEMKTREMLKRIDSLENEMELDDRPFVVDAKVKVQEIHDEWLLGIMGAK